MKHLLILLPFIFLYSCTTESNIFDAKKYYLSQTDKLNARDSFRVVKVIDNREIKDYIIGEVDYKKRPLIINRPLTDYLKMSFNSLICRDTNKNYTYPITVTVNEFYSGRESNFYSDCAYLKYSFLFTYTYNNRENKLVAKDSLFLCGDPDIPLQRAFIRDGIRYASQLFIFNHFNNYPVDSLAKYHKGTDTSKIQQDTLVLTDFLQSHSKDGLMLSTHKGFNILNSLSLSYLWYSYYTNKKLKYDFANNNFDEGFGLNFQYAKVNSNNLDGSILGISLVRHARYHSIDVNNGYFYSFGFGMSLMTEQIGKGDFNRVCFGGRLEESIGYHLNNTIEMILGLYQTGFVASKILGVDLGLTLSLNLTSAY